MEKQCYCCNKVDKLTSVHNRDLCPSCLERHNSFVKIIKKGMSEK
jgi:hypothetical protein